jgi:hypothetical protein
LVAGKAAENGKSVATPDSAPPRKK